MKTTSVFCSTLIVTSATTLFCTIFFASAFAAEQASGRLTQVHQSSGLHPKIELMPFAEGNLRPILILSETVRQDQNIRPVQHVEDGSQSLEDMPPIRVMQEGDGNTLEPLPSDEYAEGGNTEVDEFLMGIPFQAPENSPAIGNAPDFSDFPQFDAPSLSDTDMPEGAASANAIPIPSGLQQPSSHSAPPHTDTRHSDTRNVPEPAYDDSKVPVETAGFNDVVPGKSTVEDATRILGKPSNVQKGGGGEGVDSYDYDVENFRNVMVHAVDGTVFAVIADLEEPMQARQLATELGIDMIQSVFLSNEKGDIMGEIFPEIGVSFGYDPNEKIHNVSDVQEKGLESGDMKMSVVQILFQPVSPEPFLFRAESWRTEDPQRSLEDVEEALKIQPDHAESVSMKAELLKDLAARGLPEKRSPSARRESYAASGGNPSHRHAEPQPGNFSELDLPGAASGTAQETMQLPENLLPPLEPMLTEPIAATEDEEAARLKRRQAGLTDNGLPSLNSADKLAEVENLARAGKYAEAIRKILELRSRYGAYLPLMACVSSLEGDIRMVMEEPDYEQAMKCYMDAIRQGTNLLQTGPAVTKDTYVLSDDERAILYKMVIDSHFGVAANIAQGKWGNKHEAVTQWLEKGRAKAQEYITRELKAGSYEAVMMYYRVTVRSLAIITLAGKEMDPRVHANELLISSVELLKQVVDRKTYHLVCYEASLALDNTAQVCIQRGEYAHAAQYIRRGITMMEKASKAQEESDINDIFLLGNLYYRAGFVYSLHAQMANGDNEVLAKKEMDYHKSAVYYYEKAIPHLMTAVQYRHFTDQLAVGEMTAGMSVSYWEVGNHSRTEDLLKAGVLCLEHHVAQNPQDRDRLLIPYENLTQVLRYLNKKQEAERYARKLAAAKR